MDVSFANSLERVDEEEWRCLAERAGHVFATPEWLRTWWRHYGKGRRQLTGLAREGGELVAVVPLYEWWRYGVPILRFAGHGPSDQLGAVSAPLSNPVAAAALRRALAAVPLPRFVLLAELVRADEPFAELTSARPMYREAGPVLRFDHPSWDEFARARGRNFRQQVRRFPRKLSELGTLSYRLASDPERLEQDLDALFHLHRQRWDGAQTPFLVNAPFHRDFAAQALERGWLRLWFLEIDGKPVAALYGFRFAGAEAAYQAGRDPRFRHEPVGFVLLAHAVRDALTAGVREFRLGRGGDAYKDRFANSDPGLATYALTRGASAELLLTTVAAARGRSLGVRRVLDRL